MISGFFWWHSEQLTPLPVPKPTATTTAEQAVPTPTIKTSATANVYRNEEWGFQFEYPEGWEVKENAFRGYYTQFSAALFPTNGHYWDYPITVHIVALEFIDNSFKNLNKTESGLVLDGISGVKYVYPWKAGAETVVILPLKEYKIILGTNDHYEQEFADFLASFRFINE